MASCFVNASIYSVRKVLCWSRFFQDYPFRAVNKSETNMNNFIPRIVGQITKCRIFPSPKIKGHQYKPQEKMCNSN